MAKNRKVNKKNLEKNLKKIGSSLNKNGNLLKKSKNKRDKNLPLFKKIENLIQDFKRLRFFKLIFLLMLLLVFIYFGRSILFAAIVNGKPILRLKLINELEKQAGQKVLDTLITKKLIEDEAKKRGVNVSDVDISNEIEKIKNALKEQGINLDDALAMQGMNYDSLNDNIKMQLIIERLISDNININDNEIKDYYEKNKSFYNESVKFDDIKDQIKDQIFQDKLPEEYQKLIERLRNEGSIIYFMNFQ